MRSAVKSAFFFLLLTSSARAELIYNSGVLTTKKSVARSQVGGRGITPANIAGLVVWHDAGKNVYSDVGCTTPATNGQKALCWKSAWTGVEKSTQATSGLAPIYYSTAGPNGSATVHFNNLYMQMTPSVTPSVLTVFMVANKLTVGAGTFYPLNFDKFFFIDRFGTAGDVWGVYAGAEIPSTVTQGVTYTVRTVIQRNFNDVDLVTNGVVENKTNGLSFPSFTASYIHASASSMGNISELIIYGRALATTERVAIETYLKTKYGIAF